MAWIQWQIEHKGKSMAGWCHDNDMKFEVPFELEIKVGDTFVANDKSIKAISVENIGGRNEKLLIQGELDGESKKGRTPDKSGKADTKSKTDD